MSKPSLISDSIATLTAFTPPSVGMRQYNINNIASSQDCFYLGMKQFHIASVVAGEVTLGKIMTMLVTGMRQNITDITLE